MKNLWVVLLMASGHLSFGQVYHSMTTLYDVDSPSTSNPAAIQVDKKLKVFLPEIFAGYSNSGPTFSELFTKNDEGTYTLNRQDALSSSVKSNTVQASAFLQTIGVAYVYDKYIFSASHGYKNIAFLQYPKSLLQMYQDGNAQFIGEQIDIGPKIQLQNYHQYTLGIATELSGFKIGARIKYLSGVQDLSTSSSNIRLTTRDDFYQLDFDNQYELRSSSILTYEDIDKATFQYDTNIFKRPFGPNHGFGIDIGVEKQIDNSLILSAAIHDIGVVHWKRAAYIYHSRESFTYSGVDILDIIDNDQYELSDTINALLQIEEERNSYSSKLPTRIEIGGSYKHTDRLIINTNLQFQYIQNQKTASISGAAHYSWKYNITGLGSLGYYNNQTFTLGLGIKWKYKKLNTFLYTHNAIGFSNLLDKSFSNVHFGSNLSF